MGALKAHPEVAAELPKIEASVREGTLLPTLAVDRLMGLMGLYFRRISTLLDHVGCVLY